MSLSDDELLARATAAAKAGDASGLEKCFSHGLPISRINNSADSDLIINAMDGRCQSIYEVLLAHGWNVNQCLETAGSALNSAVRKGDVSLVKFLLSKGADPNGGAGVSEETLNAAIVRTYRPNGDVEILKLLLNESKTRADPNEAGALLAAVEDGSLEAVKLLVEYGADVNCTMEWDPNGEKGQRTPLYAAVSAGQTVKATYLLQNGADPDWEDVDGRTVAQVAHGKGLSEVLGVLKE